MPALSRRQLLASGATALSLAACRSTADAPAGAVNGVTGAQLSALDGLATAALIAKGEITAAEAVGAAIERARLVNPKINAIVNDTFPSALAQAVNPRPGVFSGVPTFIKDLQDVIGQPTEYGSRAYKGYIPTSQDPIVDAQLATGLISLGKSSTPESGAMSATEPLSSGPTRNPWNLEHTPGGSSGGAAALTAARVVPFADASDGGGSIRIPASCCGVFGLKPSRDRTVPVRRGDAPPLDISVVLAVSRSVRDSAAMLNAVERKGADALYPPVGMAQSSTRRLRIGLDLAAPNGAPVDPEVIAAIESTAALCEALGHSVKPVKFDIGGSAVADAFLLYWGAGSAEFVQQVAKYTGKNPSPEIVEPWSLGLAQHYQANRDKLEAAIGMLRATDARTRDLHETLGIDVLLTPVLAKPPLRIGEQAPTREYEALRDTILGFAAFTAVQNASGAPAMSVPLSWSAAGLPIGSHFAARPGDEGLLLSLAFELEAARPWADRLPPVHA
jgi:amidase